MVQMLSNRQSLFDMVRAEQSRNLERKEVMKAKFIRLGLFAWLSLDVRWIALQSVDGSFERGWSLDSPDLVDDCPAFVRKALKLK